jgi:outer membrane protein
MHPRFAHTGRAVGGLILSASCLASSLGAQSLTLTGATDAALATHPLLASAEARVGAAREAGDAARGALLPGAAVSATLTRFQEPMVVAPLHSLDLTSPPRFDRTLVQGQLAAQYTLFDGARSARIRGADVASEVSSLARDDTRMQVIEETATAYLGVLAARALLEAAVAQVEALDEERSRAGQQLAAGTVAEVEVLRAAATLQDAIAEEASARARVGAAERALARWIDADPATFSGRSLADVAARSGPPRGDALASPLVRQADRSVAAAQARLAEERGGRLPSVQAGAGLLDFGTVSGRHVTEWQAGVQVSWPLFTGGARSAAVRRAAAEVAAAAAALEAARLQAAHATDAAQTALLEADARAAALEVAVAQWEEVARIEELALDAGAGVQRDLLLAQAGLFRARAGHARARYEAILARVRLARTEGILDRTWMSEALEDRP